MRAEWTEDQVKALYEWVADSSKRIVNLEQQVANQSLALKGLSDLEGARWKNENLKSQAAQQQATNGLYAPLRSDTKPLLEMAAFVRTVAAIDPDHASYSMYSLMRDLVETAKEILKRST